MSSVVEWLKHSWNAFRGRDRPSPQDGPGSYAPLQKKPVRITNERSIIAAVKNRIAMDVATNKINHVMLDENGRYVKTVEDSLNNCLTVEANIDQTSRAFIQDVVWSMLDDGHVAIVPIETDIDPKKSSSYNIYSMRVGKIIQWYPRHVLVECYDEISGKIGQLYCEKRNTAIIENPFYAVMNEPNSTMQRLIRKLAMMDDIDKQISTGKLDMIIQFPFLIKSKMRKEQAESRRKEIEDQLTNSKYGIAYTDGTEKIMQLNRPLENNLLSQIEFLTTAFYSQLGVSPEILNGTADDRTMLNYTKRIVEPILLAITEEMKRKFLTKTARTQRHSIMFFSDPFRLVPVSDIAQIADTFTRNEILTPNELRGLIGMKPSTDARADELRNRNINQNGGYGMPYESEAYSEEEASDEEMPMDDQYDEYQNPMNSNPEE